MTRTLPPIGLGTWNMESATVCAESVSKAIDLGYRLVDTAQLYGTEESVGAGLRQAEIPTDAVIVASKVDPQKLDSEAVIQTTKESRDRLGVETIDLQYIHWPRAAYDADATLAAFDRLVEEGVIDRIGVSNFTPALWDEARDIADHPVTVNQVEMHPLLQQEELVTYAQKHGLTLVAYSPLARGAVFDLPVLAEIADQHDASEAQIALAWLVSKDNVVPIPKATGNHIAENYRAVDLELTQEEIERIDSIERTERLVDPESAPWN